MVFIIAGLLLLWLGSTLLREFLGANPAVVARRVKQGGGVAALVAALFLLIRGRIDLAFGLAGLGFWLTSGRGAPSWSGLGRAARAARGAGRVYRVRSSLVEMRLDHATGTMSGSVLAGPMAGRSLDDLDRAQCEALQRLCLTAAPEGARLLEAYLDRRFPGWSAATEDQRDAGKADRSNSRRARPDSMSEEEAYELLGLAKGAGREEIARAHRSLMKKFHPDHGGSTDLAARVNQAKDVLMRRHP